MAQAYQIVYARNFQITLGFIHRKHHVIIRDSILEQLVHEPLSPTRNRKKLDPAMLGATWELRCGPRNRFRILYEVVRLETEDDANQNQQGYEVHVLLIGEKIGEQLMIAGKAVDDETDTLI